jgi:hypothetical protein
MTDEQASTEIMRKQLQALVIQQRTMLESARAALAQSESLLLMLQPPVQAQRTEPTPAYFGSDDA